MGHKDGIIDCWVKHWLCRWLLFRMLHITPTFDIAPVGTQKIPNAFYTYKNIQLVLMYMIYAHKMPRVRMNKYSHASRSKPRDMIQLQRHQPHGPAPSMGIPRQC